MVSYNFWLFLDIFECPRDNEGLKTVLPSSTVIEIEFNEPVVVINLVLSSGTSLWINPGAGTWPVGPGTFHKYVFVGVKILKFPFLVRGVFEINFIFPKLILRH